MHIKHVRWLERVSERGNEDVNNKTNSHEYMNVHKENVLFLSLFVPLEKEQQKKKPTNTHRSRE